MYYNSSYYSSTYRMVLESERAKKENLNKFQIELVNLFIRRLLNLILLTPTIIVTFSDLAFQTFLGRVVFCTKVNPPNLNQQGVNYFSVTRCMQNE